MFGRRGVSGKPEKVKSEEVFCCEDFKSGRNADMIAKKELKKGLSPRTLRSKGILRQTFHRARVSRAPLKLSRDAS